MKNATDIIPVREQHRFDEPRLAAHLHQHFVDFSGPLEIFQFAGGQSNPTYLLQTPQRNYVLRRKPPGELLPSAHAVDREYRVLSALANTNVPVAKPLLLCEDAGVIGTSFYVMEHVTGRICRDPRLPDLSASSRRSIYDAMVDVLARIHTVPYGAIGLGDLGKIGHYVERQIHRWSQQYRASETVAIPEMDRLIEWLPAHIPDGDETTLVHGDYRLENMILHPTEPRVVAVLDWELSTLGHPLSDLAYNCLLYHTGDNDYGVGFGGLDLARLGIPEESAYVDRYCQLVGRKPIAPETWRFHLVFSMFRIAAILQGIMGRVVAGTAASKDAEERGSRAPRIASLGWELASL